jgi:hypothetical protein
MLLSALVGACTGEGGGLPSGTPFPSRSGEIALPSEPSEPEPSPTEASPTEEPTKTKEPEPSPTEEPSPTTAETTVPPASETPTPGAEGNKNKDKEAKEEEEQTYRWLLLLLLVAITVGLIVLSVRRRRSNADRVALAGHAYRSCSALRDRLAQELTTSTGVPWAQLLPLADGAMSTLYPLQTSPPDQQAALVVTHAVEAVSAVRVALQAGATTPTPSDEAKASLLRALGQLDTALEPLRFEATGRSGPGPVTGAGNG